MSPPLKALVVALVAGGAALGGAAATARVLREQALTTSHQQPTPEAWTDAPTPSSPALIAAGRRRFLKNCAHCHGIDASGDEGPDLHGLEVSDRYIGATIRRGIPHEMPHFSQKLSAQDVTALVAYLRSLDQS